LRARPIDIALDGELGETSRDALAEIITVTGSLMEVALVFVWHASGMLNDNLPNC
jgi:hypothetical protein